MTDPPAAAPGHGPRPGPGGRPMTDSSASAASASPPGSALPVTNGTLDASSSPAARPSPAAPTSPAAHASRVGLVGPPADPADGLAGDLAAAALALARRFAAGATLWCASPRWPAHARHVAVEFVHPVIVGKRALPTVQVEGPDLVSELRLLARPGDIVLAIGPASDEQVAALLRRTGPWGATGLWLGTGPRPAPGAADHVVWVDDAAGGDDAGDAELAARSGELVLLYHLLWELTHVVFEHPGLLDAAPVCEDDVCVTCSDEGRLAEVVTAPGAGGGADVLAAGRHETVDVSAGRRPGAGRPGAGARRRGHHPARRAGSVTA